jgi:hypothetical protein
VTRSRSANSIRAAANSVTACATSEFAFGVTAPRVSSSVCELGDGASGVPTREHQSAAVPSRLWRRMSRARWPVGSLSVGARSRLLATIGMRRVCRSRRSPAGWDAHRRRSRRTSMTRLMLTKDLRIVRRSAVLGACWACTDVDLQAAPRLPLRRHEVGVPDCPICPGAEVSSVGIAVPGTAPSS